MNYDRETSASERSLRGEPALHWTPALQCLRRRVHSAV